MVVWIIGLSGTGKTTLAQEVVIEVRKTHKNVVLLDGDMVREVFDNDLGHTEKDRLKNAKRICKLGKYLDDQEINVVCAILSLFPESRLWNRQMLDNYYEVFIDTPLHELVRRDSKGLYKRFQSGEARNVAGKDIEFIRPEYADLIIEDPASKEELLSYAKLIAMKVSGQVNDLLV